MQVLVVPIAFTSDHIETLYEIDIQYKGVRCESLLWASCFIIIVIGIIISVRLS